MGTPRFTPEFKEEAVRQPGDVGWGQHLALHRPGFLNPLSGKT